MNYKYNKKNLLTYKEKYMYTPYRGVEFLKCFFEDRKLFINRYAVYKTDFKSDLIELSYLFRFIIKRIKKKNPTSTKYLRSIASQLSHEDYHPIKTSYVKYRSLKSLSEDDSINTNFFLNALLHNILYNSGQDTIKIFVDKITHKFEVSKRIYSQYSKNFIRGEKSNRKLNLYFKVGIILSAYYSDTFNLKYLSALIKICDIISSSDESYIKSSILDKELNALFIFENVFIKTLIDQNVNIDDF